MIINNSIWLNYGGSGIAAFDIVTAVITNHIIILNEYIGIRANVLDAGGNTFSDVWLNGTQDYMGTGPGTGSISKDPRFVSLLDTISCVRRRRQMQEPARTRHRLTMTAIPGQSVGS